MFGLRGPTDCFPLGYAESSAGYGATFRNLAEEVFLNDTWTLGMGDTDGADRAFIQWQSISEIPLASCAVRYIPQ